MQFQPLHATDLPPQAQALLMAIGGTEGGRTNPYNVMYSPGARRYFSDFSRHPNMPATIASGPNRGKQSSAAGRYQFLKGTWDSIARDHGLTDFSPANQDRAAFELARDTYRRRTGRDIMESLSSGDPKKIAAVATNLSGQWTSLPSGIETAYSSSPGGFINKYNSALSQTAGQGLTVRTDPNSGQEYIDAPYPKRTETGLGVDPNSGQTYIDAPYPTATASAGGAGASGKPKSVVREILDMVAGGGDSNEGGEGDSMTDMLDGFMSAAPSNGGGPQQPIPSPAPPPPGPIVPQLSLQSGSSQLNRLASMAFGGGSRMAMLPARTFGSSRV